MTAQARDSPPTEGLRSLEVRWILPGHVGAPIAGWFGRFEAELTAREDSYLLHPAMRGLSVKIRAGQALEVKAYHGSPGILDAAGRARGSIESWRKWSFPMGQPGPGARTSPSWTMVRKRRRISRFRLANGQVVAGSAQRAVEAECAVELTDVRSGAEAWWSLGFEATGPAAILGGTLEGTAALIFAQAPPAEVDLGMGQCQSYSEWLSQRHESEPGS